MSKVQRPPLPDQNLMRDRLLDWLDRKVHSRVVLVVAEAGYGKTTLLTQFSKRTRRRVLWYRLDAGDRDWVGFLSYLIAAFRTRFPEFGTATESLLVDVPPTGPSLGQTLDVFLRELQAMPPEPIVLVLDDVHLADDAPEVRLILRELIARGPERQTIVMASRRVPSVALARLRSHGEVAELGTDDLRFDATETAQLLRETYGLPLDSNDVAEVARRTEGWAASLQAVQAALRGRGARAARKFVEQLSGADGDIYDYLAEEVVGDLPDDLQQFLMRTSVIDTITIERASAAAGISEAEARRLIESAERTGLLSRRSRESRHTMRAHPLVRGFLSARLRRDVDSATIESIHRAVARAVDGEDWRMAAYHYGRAGDVADVHRVLESGVSHILATGSYATAETLAAGLPEGSIPRNFAIVRSRSALQRGDVGLAVTLADEALQADASSELATFNAMSIQVMTSNPAIASRLGHDLSLTATDPTIRGIADATHRLIESSVHGSLTVVGELFEAIAAEQNKLGHTHFAGVGLLNLAHIRIAQGRVGDAFQSATRAVSLLDPESPSIELMTATLLRAWCLAFRGDLAGARDAIESSASMAPDGADEHVQTSAEIETLFGSASRALGHLARKAGTVDAATDRGEHILMSQALMDLRTGELVRAGDRVATFQEGVLRGIPGFESMRRAVRANLAVAMGDPSAPHQVRDARNWATGQGAQLWADYCSILGAVISGPSSLSGRILTLSAEQRPLLSMLAERIVDLGQELTEDARGVLVQEAGARPERWRDPLRRALASRDSRGQFFAASVLDVIGDQSDVRLLRDLAKKTRHEPAWQEIGRGLARSLAPRVMIEDLGKVEIRVGDASIAGTTIRRKVLSLLLFLVSRPRFAATRDSVLDTLWPDADPNVALNSLNQTIYFLRRVFEPDFKEDISPGYVHHDMETVWLDGRLIDARSSRCRGLIRASGASPTPANALALAREYTARFALDFAYEDWSTAYRDSLHAAYLRVVEHAVKDLVDTEQFDSGIELAQIALEVDPESDQLQGELMRLYKLAGAHAAAAEQEARYAATIRDLDLEAEDGQVAS